MDKETKESLDNVVRELQKNIFLKRCQAFGIKNEEERASVLSYINSIEIINKSFKTNYLTYDLYDMKITDPRGQVYEFVKKLPFRKGDENMFLNR